MFRFFQRDNDTLAREEEALNAAILRYRQELNIKHGGGNRFDYKAAEEMFPIKRSVYRDEYPNYGTNGR